MLALLKNRTFAALFSAQVIALIGTGLLTVALGLLAFDLAGPAAGAVLGTAYAIKMIAYVGLAPVANAVLGRFPRKAVLIGADLVRAGVVLCLPFIDAIWQIYLLIFVLQAASATFTPTFQAVIPEVFEDEADYTKALSLSRLTYDLENLISPALAGVLLLLMSYHWLFLGTVIGFAGSAMLVYRARLPVQKIDKKDRPFKDRLTRGARIYLATPRLRGLLALTLSAASISAFVLVNTVVMVRVNYAGSEVDLAYALAAYGTGSMVAALILPQLLHLLNDRKVMVFSALVLSLLTLAHAAYGLMGGLANWGVFLSIWAISGALYSAILTPAGRLLRRSAHAQDRPAVFTAQFSLSHICWLVTYPIAGWVGQAYGLPSAMLVLGILALIGVLGALLVWRVEEPNLPHDHPDLSPNHPHFKTHPPGAQHRHEIIIDDEHRVWPTRG